MAGVAAKLLQSHLVRSVRSKTTVLFSKKYLLLTNTAITVGLSCSGDIIQQRYEKLCRRQSHWNAKRTSHVALSGLIIGPVCHYWYQVLDRLLPGRTFSVVFKKIVWDQLIMSPVCIISYILVVSYLDGRRRRSLLEEVKNKGPPLLKAEWIIWPPAQLVNFCFLPTRYRVLYDNTVSLGFDYYYSYIVYKKDDQESHSGCEEQEGEGVKEGKPQEEYLHTQIRSVPFPVQASFHHVDSMSNF